MPIEFLTNAKYLMKTATLKLVAIFLVSVVSALFLSAPRTANACSPPLNGIFVDQGVAFQQAVPINGAWAFYARTYNASLDGLSVEVRDETDELVEGSLSEVLLDQLADDDSEAQSNWLVIWTPNDSLLPEHQYDVSVRAARPYDPETLSVDEQTTFLTTASAATDPEVAELVEEPSLTITENKGEFECCTDTTQTCNSQRCWPTKYIYQPTFDLQVELPTNDTDLQAYHRIITSAGTFKSYWNRRDIISKSMLFSDDNYGPYCVTVQTFALATQELLDEAETCMEHSDLPYYNERHLTGAHRPLTCEQLPYSDLGDDIGGDDGCGCSANPTSPGSLLGMMLFFFALGISKMSLFSRNG